MIVDPILKIFVIKINSLSVFQMNCQLKYSWETFMNRKLENSPQIFWRINMDIFLLHCYYFAKKMWLDQNIFTYILNCFDRFTKFYVYVCNENSWKYWIIRNNPPIIHANFCSSDTNNSCVSTIIWRSVPVGWVTVITCLCFRNKDLG